MTHPSKRKGNSFERELVNDALSKGHEAKRAYASNGQSLGLHEEVDVLVNGCKIQAKRRARIAKWIKPSDHVDAVVVREDRGQTFVVIPWDYYLELTSCKEETPSS